MKETAIEGCNVNNLPACPLRESPNLVACSIHHLIGQLLMTKPSISNLTPCAAKTITQVRLNTKAIDSTR